jgi:hypothetical protein
MQKNIVEKYANQNKDWLEELAISGDRVVRAMALAVLKAANDSDESNHHEKE